MAGLPVARQAPAGAQLVVVIGDPGTRRAVVERLEVQADLASVVHPRAVVSSRVSVAPGAIVLAGAVVSVDATIGAHTQVHYGVTIGLDARVGPFATVLPGANVAGSVTLGTEALVGSGAVIHQGLIVGPGATIGAGAVVTRDIAPGTVVVGVPARSRHAPHPDVWGPPSGGASGARPGPSVNPAPAVTPEPGGQPCARRATRSAIHTMGTCNGSRSQAPQLNASRGGKPASRAICQLPGYTATIVAAANRAPVRRVRGTAIIRPLTISATPLR